MLNLFLAKQKNSLFWIHIGVVVSLVTLFPLLIRFINPQGLSMSHALILFTLSTLGFAQNIGIVHQLDHSLPRGPRKLTLFTARLMHALGGLRFHSTRFAHGLHHAYLGTPNDPDRHGYLITTTFWKRMIYLAFIGPIRARFAPVDITFALEKMSESKRKEFDLRCSEDRKILIFTQLILLLLLGPMIYAIVFSALLFANVLSNIREMTEHGNHGQAAYVNIRLSPIGILFFSTPGFWFHASHHMHPNFHYFELPLKAADLIVKKDLPVIQRGSYIRYLLNGT